MRGAPFLFPHASPPTDHPCFASLLIPPASPPTDSPCVARLQTGQAGVPLFLVLGACPSLFAPMQVRVRASVAS